MANRPDWYEDAIAQVEAATVKTFLKTKAEIVAHYQKKYQGKRKESWKQHLVTDLLPFTPQTGKNPRHNLEKRFDAGPKGRLNNPEPRNKAQYEALGKKIGPVGRKPPQNGYHVHFSGQIRFSECEDREFDIDIVGKLAAELAKEPELIVNIILRVYMQQENEDEASAGICDEEGEPLILITANPDDKVIREPKRHKPGVPFKKRKPAA